MIAAQTCLFSYKTDWTRNKITADILCSVTLKINTMSLIVYEGNDIYWRYYITYQVGWLCVVLLLVCRPTFNLTCFFLRLIHWFATNAREPILASVTYLEYRQPKRDTISISSTLLYVCQYLTTTIQSPDVRLCSRHLSSLSMVPHNT